MGTKKIKIRRCPFCGGLPVSRLNVNIILPYSIICSTCLTHSGHSMSLESSVIRWNRRVAKAVKLKQMRPIRWSCALNNEVICWHIKAAKLYLKSIGEVLEG